MSVRGGCGWVCSGHMYMCIASVLWPSGVGLSLVHLWNPAGYLPPLNAYIQMILLIFQVFVDVWLCLWDLTSALSPRGPWLVRACCTPLNCLLFSLSQRLFRFGRKCSAAPQRKIKVDNGPVCVSSCPKWVWKSHLHFARWSNVSRN